MFNLSFVRTFRSFFSYAIQAHIFRSLQIMNLSNNKIKRLPENFGELKKLMTMDLSGNYALKCDYMSYFYKKKENDLIEKLL